MADPKDLIRYPAWRYHATLPPKTIQSAADEMEDWHDSPTKAVETSVPVGVPVSADDPFTSAIDATPPAPEVDEVSAPKRNTFIESLKTKRKATK